MRRTDALTNFIAILLFLAFAAYAGISAARTLRSTTVTAEAVSAEVSLSATASGIVVREETVLTGGGRYMELLAPEGARVASGAPVAAEADSPESLARIARRRELEAEIARIDASRERLRAAEDLAGRQHGVSEAARDLASAAARHDMDALQSAAAVLDALLLGEDASISEARRAELERELESLQSSSFTGAETLAAPVAGVFSSAVDGWEHLRPADLTDMTPSALEAMAAGGRTPSASAFGKLVTGYCWYFAAAMAAGDAASLTAGQTAALSFGRWYPDGIAAEVLSVSAPENGTAAVVFRCDTALADTLMMRNVSAEVVFGSYSGVRVPAGAVRRDEETGENYVWTVTAMQLERKSAEPIYEGEDFVILRRGADSGALREGDTVVVSGEDLYEGKVMG